MRVELPKTKPPVLDATDANGLSLAAVGRVSFLSHVSAWLTSAKARQLAARSHLRKARIGDGPPKIGRNAIRIRADKRAGSDRFASA
jgi:hypothetical protein